MAHIARTLFVVAIAACGACDSTPRPIAPQPLTSPGPLIAGHGALACTNCHVDNSPALDANKCLVCHARLAARLGRAKGFHVSPVVRGKPCEACHLDHRGARFDAMGWHSLEGGRDGFDHDLTGWPLEGAHRTTACDNCHSTRDSQRRQTFLGTDPLCGSCHVHPHRFTNPSLEACDRCHSAQAWQPPLARMRFDHDDREDARMPLVSAHENVRCAGCHRGAVFGFGLAVPERCDNCHQSPHAGHLFNKPDCAWCHAPTVKSFGADIFDHTERTRFDLAGHKRLACQTCHPASLGASTPSTACESCHAGRNPHGTRFASFGSPPACARCHTATQGITTPLKWRLGGFDHTKNTRFPLIGKHSELACRACHRGAGPTSFEQLDISKRCTGCHTHENVHDGRFTNAQCLQCHVAPGQH